MKKDFIVNITRLTKGVTEKGFGTILILDTSKDLDYRIYNDIQAVAEDYEATDEAYKIASRVFGQSIAPSQIAIAGKLLDEESGQASELVDFLNTIADQDFFFLLCARRNKEIVKALSTWIDTQDRMYFTTVHDLSVPASLESEKTVTMYHDDVESFIAAGMASIMATSPIGGITAKFKTINGVRGANISSTELNKLHEDGGFSYVRKLGNLETTEGYVTNGERIDVIMGSMFIKFRMEEELALLAHNSPKIPYSNTGIASLVAIADNVLKRATLQGIILEDEGKGVYTIEYTTREDTPKNDIANRVYNGIKWTAKISGAIHEGIISGFLTL